jgi:hypothetical protein
MPIIIPILTPPGAVPRARMAPSDNSLYHRARLGRKVVLVHRDGAPEPAGRGRSDNPILLPAGNLAASAGGQVFPAGPNTGS